MPAPRLRRLPNASTAPRVSGPRSAVRRRLGGGAFSQRHFGIKVAVRLRESQHLMTASLAAMDRLRKAPGHVDHGLRFHQVSIAWRDAIRWPCHRINARPDAVATPLARRDKRGRPAQRRSGDSGPGVSSHGRGYGSAGNALLSAGNGSRGAASPIKPPHHDANDTGGLSFLSSGQDRHDATDRSRVRRTTGAGRCRPNQSGRMEPRWNRELRENGTNDLERDTTVQCFAMNASTVSLNAWGFSNSSP